MKLTLPLVIIYMSSSGNWILYGHYVWLFFNTICPWRHLQLYHRRIAYCASHSEQAIDILTPVQAKQKILNLLPMDFRRR